jgi:hypothetical protein
MPIRVNVDQSVSQQAIKQYLLAHDRLGQSNSVTRWDRADQKSAASDMQTVQFQASVFQCQSAVDL